MANTNNKIVQFFRRRDKTIMDFKKLNLVEIEVFSFCNRQCWFCPNSFIDRHSKNVLMDENIYMGILDDLKSIEYRGMITYSRYNEPLSHKQIIIDRLKQARKYCPNALLHTNTNGDYLDREFLDDLYDAGLRSISIQIYLKEKEQFDVEQIKNRMSQ
ncbi:MAG: radical SAM protein, partial [Rickettsiales bacterium]|nr:radical SAM protein [Rickettsiales bacterium]